MNYMKLAFKYNHSQFFRNFMLLFCEIISAVIYIMNSSYTFINTSLQVFESIIFSAILYSHNQYLKKVYDRNNISQE